MEVKTAMGNQIYFGCSFCSCENCRYDVNSCAGICGYHADLVKPTFEFKPDWFRTDIDAIFEYFNENSVLSSGTKLFD